MSLLVLVDPRSVLPRVSIRTLSEPLGTLCRMGSEGEVDAASFRPTLRRSNATRSHRDAGFITVWNTIHTSSCFCVERHVRLLGNPDAMEQYSKLVSDGDDGPIARLLAAAGCQMQSPSSKSGVFTPRPEDVVGALDQQRPQIDVAGLGDAQLRIVAAGLASPWAQAEITAHVATSPEPLLTAQSQHIGQRSKLTDARPWLELTSRDTPFR